MKLRKLSPNLEYLSLDLDHLTQIINAEHLSFNLKHLSSNMKYFSLDLEHLSPHPHLGTS